MAAGFVSRTWNGLKRKEDLEVALNDDPTDISFFLSRMNNEHTLHTCTEQGGEEEEKNQNTASKKSYYSDVKAPLFPSRIQQFAPYSSFFLTLLFPAL